MSGLGCIGPEFSGNEASTPNFGPGGYANYARGAAAIVLKAGQLKTTHRLFTADSRLKIDLPDEAVDLVVTSPPYPLIGMWDEVFSRMNFKIKELLLDGDAWGAFELMHCELDKVWEEAYRLLRPGGFMCINIGDAIRTIRGKFRLYPNQARLQRKCIPLGLDPLPAIIWRKPANSPNKFMGSGMLPAGAYVTLEHEYILIFRKERKRQFRNKEAKSLRQASALFWEERNRFFSDIWEVQGTSQSLRSTNARKRSAAFPLDIPLRLILMFSVIGDVVLDPFMGTGTTSVAALATGRNSVGIDISASMVEIAAEIIQNSLPAVQCYSSSRIQRHLEFIHTFQEKGKKPKYLNEFYGFPVVTRQEKELLVPFPTALTRDGQSSFVAGYSFSH